jgi:hypothetical protein
VAERADGSIQAIIPFGASAGTRSTAWVPSWRAVPPAVPPTVGLAFGQPGQAIAMVGRVELGHSGNSSLSTQSAGGESAMAPWPPRASDPTYGRLSPPAAP